MHKLTALLGKLQKSGKDPEVADAIKALLASPADLDLQIDVVGQTHLANWLPNRKRVLWDLFDPRRPEWAHRCVERVLQSSLSHKPPEAAEYSHRRSEGVRDLIRQARADHSDRDLPREMRPLSAVLNGDALAVLREVTKRSPELVVRYDGLGGGLGFARRETPRVFRDYFFVGWKPDDESAAVHRVDYCSRILTPGSVPDGRLDRCEQDSTRENWGWAELPYGYAWHESVSHAEGLPDREPAGFTTQMLLALGYQP